MPLRILLATSILVSCKQGPNYEPPKENLPAGFVGSNETLTPPRDPELTLWWERFNDPTLTELIAQGDESNQSLAASLAHVRAAWASVGITESQFWPSIGLGAQYDRTKVNLTQVAAQGVDLDPYNVYAYGVGMSAWEIDLWGRIARQVEASSASASATLDLFRGTLVSVRAQIASTYMQYRTIQQRLLVAEDVVGNLTIIRDLTLLQLKNGTTSQISVDHIEAELQKQSAVIPQLRGALASATSTLAVLCGTTVGPLQETLGGIVPTPTGPIVLDVGIPASLLQRRADVRRKERDLAAAIATIGSNEALHFPQLTLSGNFYISSNTFNGLGDLSNQAYSFGPTLAWNVFSGWRVDAQVAQAKARADAALADYRNAVLVAIADVESASANVVQSRAALTLQEGALADGLSALHLAELQYQQGLVDLTTVLEIANLEASLADGVAQARGLLAQDIVALYKSLGGGWEASAPDADAEAVLQKKPRDA